jgi:hypothetical protein
MDTPVALIIFNRPDKTRRVLQAIAEARPRRLLVIADGPREGHPADVEKCAAARALIEQVDWDCEVVKNYSDVNLGCGRRPATGISWVFDHAEEAIILEDDCLPHPTFFRFCDKLLERYRDDERIMMVAGRNRFPTFTPYSYCFCRNHSNWGWASWRRAWKQFDLGVKLWAKLRETSWLEETLGRKGAIEFWRTIFDRAYAAAGNVDYWDYQWSFAVWAHDGLVVTPRINLVHNIGFGADATHTTSTDDPRASTATKELIFPLQHPPRVVRDIEFDNFVFDRAFPEKKPERLYRRVRRKISAVVRSKGIISVFTAVLADFGFCGNQIGSFCI